LERWRNQRDGEALGELLKWQRDRAHATAFRILQQSADADDAVQQAFLKLLSRTQGFDTADAFRIAVYRSVVQCALDMARAKRVQERLEKAMSSLEKNRFAGEASNLEDEEALAAAWEELKALSEEQRAMVVLCCQEGLSISDAAEVLSMPRETLRDRLKGALEELRIRLGARGITASLLLLIGWIRQSPAHAASPTLCEVLDVLLPGAPCASIPSASPNLNTDLGLSSSEGLNVHAVPQTALQASRWPVAAAAAMILLAAGLWFGTRSATRSDSARTETTAPSATVLATSKSVALETNTAQEKTPATLEQPVAPAAPVAARVLGKDEIPLTDVPPELLVVAGRSLPEFQLLEAERKMEDGVLLYELKGRSQAGVFEIKLTPDGKILEVDRDDDEIDAAAKSKEKKKAVPNPGDF